MLKERNEIDQVRVAGKGRETLIGRIPVTGDPEWQDLPVLETGILKEADKLAGFRTEDADTLVSVK